jgi:hypothetical protein
VKEAAQKYTTSALDTLAAIMGDDAQPAAARVAAARELLDRAHGKPRQELEHSGGDSPVTSITRVIMSDKEFWQRMKEADDMC